MKKINLFLTLACLALLFTFTINTQAQSERPYTYGSIWTISYVKTESGRTRE